MGSCEELAKEVANFLELKGLFARVEVEACEQGSPSIATVTLKVTVAINGCGSNPNDVEDHKPASIAELQRDPPKFELLSTASTTD
jgi:hypothetical protein